MIENGRQVGRIEDIRLDHKVRYQQALKFAQEQELLNVTDVGCGSGYGAWTMAQGGMHVLAFDRDPAIVEYANVHYPHETVIYTQSRLEDQVVTTCDLVTMFEVIEHSTFSEQFMKSASEVGCRYLMGSVPNELQVPFGEESHHEHVQHYTPNQLRVAVERAGWKLIEFGGQLAKQGDGAGVFWGDDFLNEARTLVFIAQNKEHV